MNRRWRNAASQCSFTRQLPQVLNAGRRGGRCNYPRGLALLLGLGEPGQHILTLHGSEACLRLLVAVVAAAFFAQGCSTCKEKVLPRVCWRLHC